MQMSVMENRPFPREGLLISGGDALPAPSTAHRDVKRGSRGSFSGNLLVGEYPGRVVQCESHLEMKVALILDARPEVVHLEEQVKAEWYDEHGEVHDHFFDFRAFLNDGTRLAIPVRAMKYATPEFLGRMARIASQAVPKVADEICLFTEADIDPVEYENAKYLNAVKDPDPEADAAARRSLCGMSGAATFEALTDAINLGQRGFRAVARLLRWGEIRLMRHERIAPAALVGRV